MKWFALESYQIYGVHSMDSVNVEITTVLLFYIRCISAFRCIQSRLPSVHRLMKLNFKEYFCDYADMIAVATQYLNSISTKINL